MTEISRTTLFGKLNPVGYRAVEGATVFCKLRGNPYVELVHWLHQILQAQDSDLHRIIRHFELDASRLAADIPAALDKLPRGATAISDFSPHIEEMIERAWVLATLMFGENIRSAPGICCWQGCARRGCATCCCGISRQFDKVKAEALGDGFAKIVVGLARGGAVVDRWGCDAGRGQRLDGARRLWARVRRWRSSPSI